MSRTPRAALARLLPLLASRLLEPAARLLERGMDLLRGRAARPLSGRRPSLRLVLLAWALAEVVAFALVARLVGAFPAVMLLLLKSGLGTVLLGRYARAGLSRARSFRFEGLGPGAVPDALAAALGAGLLVLPGIVSGVAGLALLTPSLRRGLLARLAGGAPSGARGPVTLDLEGAQWREVEAPVVAPARPAPDPAPR